MLEACEFKPSILQKIIKPQFYRVLDGLRSMSRRDTVPKPAVDLPMATLQEAWLIWGSIFGIKEMDDLPPPPPTQNGPGCGWLRCPLSGIDDATHTRRLLVCQGCKKVHGGLAESSLILELTHVFLTESVL